LDLPLKYCHNTLVIGQLIAQATSFLTEKSFLYLLIYQALFVVLNSSDCQL